MRWFEGQRHRAKFNVHGHRMKTIFFGCGCNRLIEKVGQCGKMQTVTTLCRFQCGVTEVCAVPNIVVLHRVSKTSHLWLVITLTHVNRF